jgi:pyridoxine 4-dehydrogenase
MQIATIAYSPLAVGRLTGKYSNENRPRGNRNFGDISWVKIQPIVDELTAIGREVGKTPTAVALNWVMCKGAIPIPTCKNATQVEDCAQSLGWRLSDEQEERLDKVGRVNDWDLNLVKHFQNWWWQQG